MMIESIVFVPNPLLETAIKMDPGVQAGMARVGDVALAELRSRIPVLTGALLASARIERVNGEQRLVVGTDHWLFPEYGTSKMAPEPYLRPTLTALGLGIT